MVERQRSLREHHGLRVAARAGHSQHSAEGRPVTQRALAERLGIALGLVNLYLKRLARKGYIKVTTIPANRIRYLLTPRGFAQKARLTYEYIRYSLRLYREARQTLREALAPLARDRATRIAIYGTGEAAELAYRTLRELGIEPAAVHSQPGDTFLGRRVVHVAEATPGDYDRVILATFDQPNRCLVGLLKRGFARNQLVTLDRYVR